MPSLIRAFFLVFCLIVYVRSKENRKHPFLFFNEEDIPVLQQRARTTHVEIANRIRDATQEMKQNPEKYLPPTEWDKFSSAWNERFGNDLCAIAFYCVINPEDIQAIDLAILFMDRLENLPNWRVNSSLHDDVPVAHSLVGMTTAYDYLYLHLNSHRRTLFLAKITAVTKELYERSSDRHLWWGTSYLQNHVATNYVAILTGALVVAKHQSIEAEKWIARAHLMLSRNLELWSIVVDGSINEGVAYGTYTSRSVTQYVFLALRHFRVDFTRNPWLKEHFWFMYYTILSGFKETVGIGDSNRNWFYGPESQLVFLDSYVMRNGLGNWLAKQIREHRLLKSHYTQALSHANCMLHTEFLFYNASIKERAQPNPTLPRLRVFSDWGVVTYGGGVVTPRRNNSGYPSSGERTFLSFKCSVLHGRAINTVVRGKRFRPWIRGWRNFNPGHEQPDQGSFVFAPNGVPFITETLYANKYTWLNNALLFGPSLNSECFSPFEGQIGECYRWFEFKKMSTWSADGDIITASNNDHMVFVSGEMSQWYRTELGLLSVYRNLLMLTPTVLLVVDHIERTENCKTSIMSAFFHNVNQPFMLNVSRSGDTYATMSIDGLLHEVYWFDLETGMNSLVKVGQYGTGYKSTVTNYINITTHLGSRVTRTAYLFLGPGNRVDSLRLLASHEYGLKLLLKINDVKYIVSIATKHGSPYTRYLFLGFGGFCKVRINDSKTVRFGVDTVFAAASVASNSASSGTDLSIIWRLLASLSLVFCVSCSLLLFCLKLQGKILGLTTFKVVLSSLMLLWVVLTFKVNFDLCTGKNCLRTLPSGTLNRNGENDFEPKEDPPFVLYTSLPLAGNEILHYIFKNASDFFGVVLPADSQRKFLDPCTIYTRFLPPDEMSHTRTMLRALAKYPEGFLKNVPKISLKALPSVRLGDPGWSMKLPWIRKVLGSGMRAIVVIRDPRGWVNSYMREIHADRRVRDAVHGVIDAIANVNCPKKNLSYFALEFQEIHRISFDFVNDMKGDILKFLSHLWATHLSAMYRANSHLPPESIHYVKFEDLINKPRKTMQRLFQFIGVPFSPLLEHRILTAVRTGRFTLSASRTEVLDATTATAWERELSREDARRIIDICAPVMQRFRYDADE
ncbi:dermatan-sulfate epimerase-like protein [Montipora capricornis]|uniref:dermatan-sulfate epimerase-like protein n=1 Tax=Montipora capricornis TaxID=246305 RepID=UPI0035F16A06